MKAKLFTGIGTGLLTSLALVTVLSVTLGAAAPADDAAIAPAAGVAICHLEKKVDPSLRFNDGHVISPNRAACRAHCRHGDHPMSKRSCARVHAREGLPSCEVNTPATSRFCSVDRCIAAC